MTDSPNHRPEIADHRWTTDSSESPEPRDSASKKNQQSKLQLRTNGLALPPGMMG